MEDFLNDISIESRRVSELLADADLERQADDGVTEFLSIMLGDKSNELDQSVELVATDTDSSWTVGLSDTPQLIAFHALPADS